MPNLAGIWAPELAEPAVGRIVADQLERIRVPNNAYSEFRVVCAGFGMALQDPAISENGPQPASRDDGNTTLLLDGEISNATELAQRFASVLPARHLHAPELCLHLIAQMGAEVAKLFNGMFCIVVHDRKARRMTIINDRYGARPLYYVRRPDAVVFGTEIKALAVADPGRREVDEVGILELFCYGSHFMDRTWMESYRRLPPASILTVEPERFAIGRYWTYRYDEDARELDQESYATVFGILLDRAVERCMQGSKRIGVFLSGGYDSRSVVAALRPHHRPLHAYTFGLPESRDVRFAAMLAQRLGLEHHVLDRKGPYLIENLRSIVWRTEGMMTFANATSIQWHSLLKQDIDIILTGFLGEFSGSHTWPDLLLARSRQAAMRAIFRRFVEPRKGLAERIFQPEFLARTFPALTERFAKSFDSIEGDHPLNISDCWNFVHLQPRGTFHAPAVDRYMFEMRAPHTDNDLVDFLLTIPPYARLEQRVYKKTIAYSFPQIRDIPCTNSARPIDPNFVREYARMTGSLVAQKARSALRPRGASALGREFRDVGQDFRAEPELTERILPGLVDAGILPGAIFNRQGIAQLVQEHREQGGKHHHAIGLLISLGFAMKYFLHDDVSDVPSSIYAFAAVAQPRRGVA